MSKVVVFWRTWMMDSCLIPSSWRVLFPVFGRVG